MTQCAVYEPASGFIDFSVSFLMCVVTLHANSLNSKSFFQDEYSIFPQTYSIDINGYILVYSVTSNKRYRIPSTSQNQPKYLLCPA